MSARRGGGPCGRAGRRPVSRSRTSMDSGMRAAARSTIRTRTATGRPRSRPRTSPWCAYHVPALAEWLLIDGSSMIFRAFYGVPQTTRAPDGTLVNAVRGFLETLARLISERKPRHVVVTTDEDWRP